MTILTCYFLGNIDSDPENEFLPMRARRDLDRYIIFFKINIKIICGIKKSPVAYNFGTQRGN